MAGLNKTEAAKKGVRSKLAHNERPKELPAGVDWAEQERLERELTQGYIPSTLHPGRSGYSPGVGVDLCLMRRSGLSARMICAATGIREDTIRKWLDDNPEFAQEWKDCYHDYVLNNAEELVARTEALLEQKRLDGKKLTVRQEKRYIKALEIHQAEVHWASARRVPEMYGEDDTGSELVIVSPMEIPRQVTQATDRAAEWRKEVADARADSDSASDGADGSGGGVSGEGDNGGAAGAGPAGVPKVKPKRRYPRGSRPLLEPRKRKPNASQRPDSGGQHSDSPGQQS